VNLPGVPVEGPALDQLALATEDHPPGRADLRLLLGLLVAEGSLLVGLDDPAE
jgi:hypothetical protein